MRLTRALTRALVPAAVIAGSLGTGLPAASAAALPGCTSSLTVTLCFVEDGEVVGFSVPNVTVNPLHVANVAAYLDVYRVAVNASTYDVVPCVVRVVDGVEDSTCETVLGSLSLTRSSRTPLVADTSVDGGTVSPDGGAVVRVSVCEARATIRVEPFGVNDQELLTLCAEGLPTV